MRIGITCYPTHGGSGVVATELGKHLAERGHEVAFISYSTPHRLGKIPKRVTYHEVESVEYPLLKEYPYTLALASKMAEVARQKQLDILHVHYAIPFASAAVMAKQIVTERNLKVVTTLHGTDVTRVGNNSSFKAVTKLAIEQSDYVTAVSNFLKDQTYEEFGVNKNISTIYNFIDPERYESQKSDVDYERKRIIHISNFRPVKRIEDVIYTFSKIAAHCDAELILVGDGPECCKAVSLVTELGLQERVRFRGIVDEVSPVLRKADLMLLPSETESFGLVALEAMAAGVPVVASDVGGLPEVINHGICGYLAPLGDTDAMARYCLDILTDNNKLKAFSDAARAIAVDTFHYKAMVPQYEALYEQAIAESQ